jgi:hypothetical protein
MNCILQLLTVRGWKFACLSDLNFFKNGVREYIHEGRCWTMIIRGKVGVLLHPTLAGKGGGEVKVCGRQDNKECRAMAIPIPREGKARGLTIVSVYAPVARQAQDLQNRIPYDNFLEEVTDTANKTKSGHFMVVGGDFNAELGRNTGEEESGLVGNCGVFHRSRTGEDVVAVCKQNNWCAVSTCFQQRQPATWWHPRYRTAHQIDHIMVPTRERWGVTDCRTLHFGPGGEQIVQGNKKRNRRKRKKVIKEVRREDGAVAWAPYTDHEPVEITIRMTGWGPKQTTRTPQREVPDYRRLSNGREEGILLREKYEEKVRKNWQPQAPK